MNNDIKKIILSLCLPAMVSGAAMAQSVSGRVLSSDNKPVAGAVISAPGARTVRTGKDGRFTITGLKDGAVLSIWHDGYYTKQEYVPKTGDGDLTVYIIEDGKYKYSETRLLPFGTTEYVGRSSAQRAGGGGNGRTSTNTVVSRGLEQYTSSFSIPVISWASRTTIKRRSDIIGNSLAAVMTCSGVTSSP